jgi:hypothetical protein
VLRSVTAEKPEPTRLALHRRVFLWAHGVLAFLSMCVYLNQMLLGPSAFASGTMPLLLISVPALWPYLASGVASWQFVSEQTFGFYLFLTALLISGVVSVALALGVFGVVTDARSLLMLYVCQTAVHFLSSWLLDIEDWSPSNNRWRGQ